MPTFATTRTREPEAMIDEAMRILDAGWDCMRLTIESMGIGGDNIFEPFRFWEAPHLHRRDGSYTNW